MAFDAEDIITFGRIGRFSVELRDLVGNRSVAVVERSEQGFEEGMSADFTIELVGEEDSAGVSLNGDGSGTMTFSPVPRIKRPAPSTRPGLPRTARPCASRKAWTMSPRAHGRW